MADIVALFRYRRMDQPCALMRTDLDTTGTPFGTVAYEINRHPSRNQYSRSQRRYRY
jgi:hypothetical protein